MFIAFEDSFIEKMGQHQIRFALLYVLVVVYYVCVCSVLYRCVYIFLLE